MGWVDSRISGDHWIQLLFLVWRVRRTERSSAELTEATLKVNTRINFTLAFAPTLTTKLIFAFVNLELVDWKFSLQWYLSTENHHFPQRKCQCICSACKIYFFDWKKHSCPEWAYITNDHVSSHRQSHKTTESEDVHANKGRQKGHKKNKRQSRRMVLKWFMEVRLNEKFFALFLWRSFALNKNRIEEKQRSVQRDGEKRIIEYRKEVLASYCGVLHLRDAVVTLPSIVKV